MIKKLLVMLVLSLAGAAFADATVTLTKAQPRYPWNGLVDFTYTISGRTGSDLDYIVRFSLGGVVCSNFVGQAWCDLPVVDGTHTVTWDAKADGWNSAAKDVTATVDLVYDPVTEAEANYLIVDISAGKDAAEYPVRYVRGDYQTSQFLRDEYKTTKIVLKKVPRGEFKMGTGNTATGTTWHPVRLTKDFWLGVFEVTQRQYTLVVGSNPSGMTSATSAYFMPERVNMRPVERLVWNTITDETGFLGLLSAKAKCRGAAVTAFTLPTEAQWEYACRAGCESKYNWGMDANTGIRDRAWVGDNSDQTHEVGRRAPNNWGFYDMAGNVAEYCQDWEADYGLKPDSPVVENPTGPDSGTYKIVRGGSYYNFFTDQGSSGNRTQPGNKVTADIDINANKGHWGGAWVNSLGMRICATISMVD